MLSPWSTTHVIQPTGAVDLSTTYLGLNLRNPIVASPSPLTGTIDGLGRLVAAGVGAVVLPSILEEQVWNEAARRLERMPDGIGSLDRVASRRPAAPGAVDDAAGGLELIREAAAAFDVPVIASLNGGAAGGWPTYAHALQQAGAAAIELNIYEIPAEAALSARAVEDRHLEILQTVKSVVTIPVAVKLAPWLTSLVSWPRGWSRRAPTGWSSSTASCSPTSTSNASRSCRGSSSRRPSKAVCR